MPGSVYKRKDGYWCAALTVGGRRIVRYATSRREAEQKLADLLVEARLGRLARPATLCLQDWWQEWLQGRTLRPTTRDGYERALAPILREIGTLRLDRLTPALLAGLFARLRQAHGPRLVQKGFAVLKGCMQTAADLGLLPQNPLAKVPAPTHESRPRRYWTLDEARTFVRFLQGSRAKYAPLFLLLLGTGMRLGEALALTWADIDWGGRRLWVDKNLTCVRGTWHEGRPKTRTGIRWVPCPTFVLAALQNLPRPLDPSARVFVTATGRPPKPTNLRMEMARFCDQAGVPRLPIHGLRHVAAALLVAAGVDLKTVQAVLGHSRVQMTLDIYAYALGREGLAAEALDRALSQG
jgi:integrase